MDYGFSPCTTSEITATDLREEMQKTHENAECAHLSFYEHDGHRHAESGQLVFFPKLGRAGIAWGGDAQWTDANSIENALDRYVAGEMVE